MHTGPTSMIQGYRNEPDTVIPTLKHDFRDPYATCDIRHRYRIVHILYDCFRNESSSSLHHALVAELGSNPTLFRVLFPKMLSYSLPFFCPQGLMLVSLNRLYFRVREPSQLSYGLSKSFISNQDLIHHSTWNFLSYR